MESHKIENGHRNSGIFHKKWWFSIVMLVYQRVVNGSHHLKQNGNDKSGSHPIIDPQHNKVNPLPGQKI
jgi:hypothetical protein